MPFDVRIFAHRGLSQIPVIQPTQNREDSVYQLHQPYEWAQKINVGAVAASSAADANVQVRVLRIEVPDGQAIRYEINPPGRNVAAGTNSPKMSGENVFYFRESFTISLIDAAGLP